MEMGNWEEELYQSSINAGQLQEKFNYPEEIIISTYLRGIEFNQDRIEAYFYLVKYCRQHNRSCFAYAIAKEGLKKKMKGIFLFSEQQIYDWGMLDEFAISAYWAGHFQESYDACVSLLEVAPLSQQKRILENLNFAKDKL